MIGWGAGRRPKAQSMEQRLQRTLRWAAAVIAILAFAIAGLLVSLIRG